jgi:F-type H+-transporting ATPase subunit a
MNWNFSPLEQFDSVTFIGGSRFFESINLYSFYIFETEYSTIERIQNGYTSFLGLPVASNVTFYLVIFVIAALFFAKTFMKVSLDMLPIFSNEVRFSNFFLALAFSIFLPTAFDFVFLTVPFFQEGLFSANFYTTNSLDVLQNGLNQTLSQSSFKLEALPQNHFFFFFDENLISFVLAFFLLGGSEDEEDEDFLLEEEESDFVDDVVAPLFLANLGKDIEGNGQLLVKVSSIFSFVFVNNLMGMLPYSDTGTSSLMLTFWVALSIFVTLLTLMLRKHGISYFFSLFMPAGCPLPLLFLLIPIEFISYSFRLVSLSVRLFANMMAGHTLLKVIVGFSFSMILMGDSMLLVNLFPIAVLFVLTFLEVGVALIQAYIFTILTCIYLKDIFTAH